MSCSNKCSLLVMSAIIKLSSQWILGLVPKALLTLSHLHSYNAIIHILQIRRLSNYLITHRGRIQVCLSLLPVLLDIVTYSLNNIY